MQQIRTLCLSVMAIVFATHSINASRSNAIQQFVTTTDYYNQMLGRCIWVTNIYVALAKAVSRTHELPTPPHDPILANVREQKKILRNPEQYSTTDIEEYNTRCNPQELFRQIRQLKETYTSAIQKIKKSAKKDEAKALDILQREVDNIDSGLGIRKSASNIQKKAHLFLHLKIIPDTYYTTLRKIFARTFAILLDNIYPMPI